MHDQTIGTRSHYSDARNAHRFVNAQGIPAASAERDAHAAGSTSKQLAPPCKYSKTKHDGIQFVYPHL